ncbi:MAG: hypothetical protein GY913_01165 [Proteobacteria bacterium]|nr:hypothetical protein [Pseudomonadota bacterium]MCP4915508.1 hypothetical protein [Pseudomonadota bacterium]
MFPLLTSFAFAGTLAPGEEVERAIAVHLSNGGFRHMGDAIEGLVPPGFPIQDVEGEVECDEADANPLLYTLEDTELILVAEDVELVASDGRLDIAIYMTLQSDPADLTVSGDCSILTELDETCTLQFKETSIVARLGLEMELIDTPDGPAFDVTVEDPVIEMSPINNPLQDCTLADAVDFILIDDPNGITNILMSFIEPELVGLGADLEVTIEDALSATTIETSFEFGEAELELAIYPTLLELDERGLLLGLGGTVNPAQLSECVPPSEGSEFADSDWPAFDETAWTTSLEYDGGLFVSKDFVDHILWALYASGGLCLDVGELAGDTLALTTELFASIFGEEFAALFKEEQPLGLVTAPAAAPEIVFSDDMPPFALRLNQFGLDFSANLDDREARLFQVGLDMDVGIDPGLSSTELAPAILIDTEAIDFSEPYNELLPDGFSAGLADFLPTILAQFLPDDLLPIIALPDLYGIGIDTVFWTPDEDLQWQGGFILLDVDGVVPYEVPGCQGGDLGCGGEGSEIDIETILGCSSDGGCSDEGCSDEGCSDEGCSDSGCATHGRHARIVIPGRFWMFAFIGAMGVLRRRQD